MANAVLGYGPDRVAAGTVTVSTELPTLLGVNLQYPHLSPKVWRSTANSATINVDFGASYTIGCLFLGATNMTAAGTNRIRISANSNMSSPTYDTGASPDLAGVDPNYGHLVHVLASPAAGRYLRIELADSSLSYIEAGRLWAGTKFQPSRNFAFGYRRTYVDSTRMTRADTGQVWVEAGTVARELRVQLHALTDAEIQGDIATLGLLGRRDDVLFVTDPDSTNLGRDSIFGLITEDLSEEHSFPNVHVLDLVIAERK